MPYACVTYSQQLSSQQACATLSPSWLWEFYTQLFSAILFSSLRYSQLVSLGRFHLVAQQKTSKTCVSRMTSFRFLSGKFCKQAFLATCPLHVTSISHQQPPMWEFHARVRSPCVHSCISVSISRNKNVTKYKNQIGTVMLVSNGAGSAWNCSMEWTLDMARSNAYSGNSYVSQ